MNRLMLTAAAILVACPVYADGPSSQWDRPGLIQPQQRVAKCNQLAFWRDCGDDERERRVKDTPKDKPEYTPKDTPKDKPKCKPKSKVKDKKDKRNKRDRKGKKK